MKYRVPTLEIRTLGITVTGCGDCPFREYPDTSKVAKGEDPVAVPTCRLTRRVIGEPPYTTGAWETCPMRVSPAMVRLVRT